MHKPFLYDLKLVDLGFHKSWTQAGNEKIVQNLRSIAQNKYNKLGKSENFEKLKEPEKGALDRIIPILPHMGLIKVSGG